MVQEQSEKDAKECGGKNAALLDTAVYAKGLGGATIELHCPLHVVVEGFDQAMQFWWASYFGKNLKESFPADQIEGLC